MKYLILIGNGFDKAHNLKTTYHEFIENLFNNYFSDRNSYKDILDSESLPLEINSIEALRNYSIEQKSPFGISVGSKGATFKNYFLGQLIHDFADDKWYDIEKKYFENLMSCVEHNWNPEKLNNDFNDVKKYLSYYLIEEEKNAVGMDSYACFFDHFANSQHSNSETMILNFNYTKTIEKLYSNVIKCPVIHIHGELEKKENPIIFGYAAKHDETNKLLSKNNNEFLKNIKMYLYKRTKNKDRLKEFLGLPDKRENTISVLILGHSCGLSDNLILSEIFNSTHISSIRIFYYESYDNFFDTKVNTSRIMDNHKKFDDIVVNFEDTHRMPQQNDDENQLQNFTKYIKSIEQPSPKPPSVGFLR